MTAFLAVKQTGRVHLLTDGACYDADGTMAAVGNKVIELPKASAAVTLRGLQEPGPMLADAFGEFKSFDALIARAPGILTRVKKHWRDICPIDWEAMIVGVSQAGVSEIHFCPIGGELTAVDDGYYAAGPQPTARTYIESGFVPFDDLSTFDPVTHGVPVMEAFRRTRAACPGLEDDLYGVGAFIAHTLVERDSTATKIIHLWPDVLGEKIDPARHGFKFPTGTTSAAKTGLTCTVRRH